MIVMCPFCGEQVRLVQNNKYIPLHYSTGDNVEEFDAYEDVCNGSNQVYEEDEEDEDDEGPEELNFD